MYPTVHHPGITLLNHSKDDVINTTLRSHEVTNVYYIFSSLSYLFVYREHFCVKLVKFTIVWFLSVMQIQLKLLWLLSIALFSKSAITLKNCHKSPPQKHFNSSEFMVQPDRH